MASRGATLVPQNGALPPQKVVEIRSGRIKVDPDRVGKIRIVVKIPTRRDFWSRVAAEARSWMRKAPTNRRNMSALNPPPTGSPLSSAGQRRQNHLRACGNVSHDNFLPLLANGTIMRRHGAGKDYPCGEANGRSTHDWFRRVTRGGCDRRILLHQASCTDWYPRYPPVLAPPLWDSSRAVSSVSKPTRCRAGSGKACVARFR